MDAGQMGEASGGLADLAEFLLTGGPVQGLLAYH